MAHLTLVGIALHKSDTHTHTHLYLGGFFYIIL